MILSHKVLRLRFDSRGLSFFRGKKESGDHDKPCTKPKETRSKENPQSLDCSAIQPKVIIIGAGIAGLSAAQHLILNGCENILILEASDRVGGRLLSAWMGDTCIDIGANTIYGGSMGNSFYNMVHREGLLENTKILRNDPKKAMYITTDNRILEDTAVPTIMFNRFLEQAINIQRTGKGYTCASVKDFISLRIQQELLSYPTQMRFDAERLLFGMLNNLRSTTGAELDNLSAMQFVANKKIPGGNVKMERGFGTVLANLIRDLPKEKIKLRKQVRYVHWYPDYMPQVKVICDCDDYECGNFVISTLPLGVLKKCSTAIFKPELPQSKQHAIKILGVGHVNRVCLEYSYPWWAPEQLSMKIAWSPQELRQWNSWTKGIGSIESVNNSHRVIMFTIGGKDALAMEQLPEIQIAIEFTQFIRTILSDSSIPYPCNIAASRWSSSPYYLGGSVYMPVGVSDAVINCFKRADDEVCAPHHISPLLFAGEATHEYYFGTLHGARTSGIREANKVLKFAKSRKNLNLSTETNICQRCASKCS